MPDETVTCRACGKPTPDENLRCIFCGELLSVGGGVLGRIRYGRVARWLFAAVAVVILLIIVCYWV